LLKDAYRSTIEEQVTNFLHILSYNVKNLTFPFIVLGKLLVGT